MDDSDQDFVDLYSKLLKRVRRKAGEPGQPSKAEARSCSQAATGDKRRRHQKETDPDAKRVSATQPLPCGTGAEPKPPAVNGGLADDPGHTGSSVSVGSGAPEAEEVVATNVRAKDKVLLRMQQFKRASPQRIAHQKISQLPGSESDCVPPLPPQRRDSPEPATPGLHQEPQDSDEVLALRLQQELDREAAEAQVVDLEDRGLFFCQLCHRDLSHMSPEGRTQHLNRCLDENEDSAPAPPPAPSGVSDCPICGKKFKSQKSRSAHLKRCSSEMGVSPAVLLQALQRQATEAQADSTANQPAAPEGTKRKAPSEPGIPAKKKPRKKTQPLDEDTMLALALSSSLLEQEREREVEKEFQRETAASHTSMTPLLKWRPDAGKGRGRKRKGGVPRPPPLLLIQDAEAALRRIQERVSALLLCGRAPSPPTPKRCPSSLSAWSGDAPLWEKSALRDGGPSCESEFYTPELREFIMPQDAGMTDTVSSTSEKPDSSVQTPGEDAPVPVTRSSIIPSTSTSSSKTAPSSAASASSSAKLSIGSQAVRDLVELAEDGMTLTQWGYTASGPAKDIDNSSGLIPDLHLSGFVLEEPQEQADLCLSGFLPETTTTYTRHPHCQARTPTGHSGADREQGSHKSVMLSRLASDLSSMVNNPQLSDVQLQVDSGEVYFAHSFMLYTRCPLLAQMVHDSGFGVQEEGMPAAQRILVGEVPGQAVYSLLQYVYTAHCPISASLLPHLLELASRFDLEALRQHCQLYQEEAVTQAEGADCAGQEQPSEEQTDHAFMDLLQSMWNEEDEDTDEGRDGETGLEKAGRVNDLTLADKEICEEKVNEEEMEEIYEFAATQRKREEGKGSTEEEEEDEKEGDLEMEDNEVFTKPDITEPKMISTGSKEKSVPPVSNLEPDHNLNRSYSRLFSDSWGVYEEEDPSSPPSSSCRSKTQTCQSQHLEHSTTTDKGKTQFNRTCLQSSASEIIDLSISPPPSTSNLPLPGLSPGEVGNGGDERTDSIDTDFSKECALSRDERPSQGCRSICAALSPASPQNRKEPELIVLSDSSEEMEVDLAAASSRRPSPCTSQNVQNFTQIKPQPVPQPNEATLEKKESCSFGLSPSTPSAFPVPGRSGFSCDALEQSPVDCSPEVSWLVPATPVQPSRNTITSSTQTHSSMRRTQLFPKASVSPSSSPVLSSPRLSLKSRRHKSDTNQTQASVSRKLEKNFPCSSGMALNCAEKNNRSSDVNMDREVESSDNFPLFAGPHKCSQASSFTYSLPFQSQQGASMQPNPLHIQSQQYSSTPLHTDLHKPPVHLPASPVHCDPERESSFGQVKEHSDREIGSLRLSSSNLSDSPSSSSYRGLSTSTQRGSTADNTGTKLTGQTKNEARGIRNDTGNGIIEREEEGRGTAGEQKETSLKGNAEDALGGSFQQSFTIMDEPPMAFNDSWGLDVGADREGNPGVRFSLRLEDSGGSSPHDRSPGQGGTAGLSSSTTSQHPNTSHVIESFQFHNPGQHVNSTPPKLRTTQPSSSPTSKMPAHTCSPLTPPPPDTTTPTPPHVNGSLLDSKLWDSWNEEEEEEALPLSQRVNPQAHLKTPVAPRRKRRGPIVPITPMPSYSDMDTPELKSKLNRFGVRPLPKRQMILKLKEIHHYTHQLVSSDSEDEPPSEGRTTQVKPLSKTTSVTSRPAACVQAVSFKLPRAPMTVSPRKHNSEEDAEPLSASQGSNSSSAAASEESERSNPELCLSSDSDTDSDGGVTASQAASRLQDRLRAVRSFILSDSELYSQILQYQPLVISQLQERLKAAGIRLGASKLLDYLDSQCITFTTAKPGHTAASRRRGRRAKAAGERHVRGRKRGVTARDY
ncbi:structure-specific endonuclease subunit SLX4 [Myripristis murdjan]|uniref:Structure-specific endonuclease subunit SLX4 n=1 Tax=Myripristis murdjan TaxID=586833 RepID=A0A667ZP95_9TELE|nr:structure-specific endonuclease subunit SLX4 [Myripristis murdjan]XP_029916176.1 structure-specific endonuclease subunit SLX4 [Myripristis murdjan]XP_029916258.1 structure-specific endonuclease subunit SLX4 [Myripristis murdjan]